MKLLELHILQSFPVSCLNRDDLNSPKTAVFGGVNRARVSSQSWKRAIRLKAKEILPEYFGGMRTLYLKEQIERIIAEKGKKPEDFAERIGEVLYVFINGKNKKGKKDEEEENEGEVETKKAKQAIVFLSEKEAEAIADIFIGTEEKVAGKINDLIENGVSDFSDIAIFGRMAASNTLVNVEAAGMFSHAISTHKVENDIDFFAAVDEKQPEEKSGSGHIGTLEFNSATYYRYIALNLDLLKSNLKDTVDGAAMKKIVETFIKACVQAVPSARKNSMNANTLPDYVLGIVKESGQPIQLVNAFENPIKREADGIKETSKNKLEAHLKALKETWGIDHACEVSVPEKTFNQFLGELVSHV